jgi:hypothetical protein
LEKFEEKKNSFYDSLPSLKFFSKSPTRNISKVFSLVPGRIDKVKIIETFSVTKKT